MSTETKISQNSAPISRRTVIIVRIIFFVLFVVWVAGGIYFYSEIQKTEAQIVQVRQEAQRKEELLRREAAYRRAALEQQTVQSGVQNAVDTFRQ